MASSGYMPLPLSLSRYRKRIKESEVWGVSVRRKRQRDWHDEEVELPRVSSLSTREEVEETKKQEQQNERKSHYTTR